MYYNSVAGSFLSKKLCSRLHSTEVEFYSKKGKVCFLSHPLGDLELTYTLHLLLIGKPLYDFLFVIIELFSLALTVETLQAEICRRERFLKGVGHFNLGGRGHRPLTTVGWQKTRRMPFHVV